MLSLSSNLSTQFSKDSTSSFWYIKLYYDNESSFIGLSDKDRTINSVVYHGVVTSWGTLNYSANLNDFEVKFGTMSLKVANTTNAIEGQRFSDYYSDKEFTNRKWELYVADENVTSHSDHQILATGIIGVTTSYDEKTFTVTLNDILNKYNIEIPTTLLSGVDVPPENVGKPVPFVYGDFDRNLSLPSSAFDRHTGEHAPMIVSNKWDATQGGIEAKADTETLHTVRDKNMEMYLSDVYASFDDNLVTISNPKAYISGNLLESGAFVTGVTEVQNFSNSSSKDLSSSANAVDFSFGVPHLPKGQDRTGLNLLVYYTSDFISPGSTDFLKFTDSSNNPISANLANGTNLVASIALSTDSAGRQVKLRLDSSDSGDSFTVSVFSILIVGDYTIEDVVVEKKINRFYHSNANMKGKSYVIGEQRSGRTVSISTDHNVPKEVRMMYGSLKGRKYSSDLTSGRSNGYTTSDFIENPVYMIEDIGRKFLGASIDTATFDDYGTKTTGKLKNIFNTSNTSDVKLRFSQYSLEDADGVLKKICRQSGLFYHFNESGALRIFGRKRAGTYDSGDITQTIDFNDCNIENIALTDSGHIRNKISLTYNFDYGSEQTIENTSSSEDSTSKGTSSSGYNITNELIFDAPYIADSTVADAYEDTLLDYYKDRKPVLKITTSKMKYVNIEIGDIVILSNFPSDLKIFGTALASSDYFMVTNVSKSPNMTKLTLTEVS